MSRFDRVGDFDPTKTYALTTGTGTPSDPFLGAPDMPGTIRYRIHPSGFRYGIQGFRLCLNESTATIVPGDGAILGAATAYTGLALTGLWGAALTTPRELLVGGPLVSVADDYWGWFQVYGVALDGLDPADDIDAGDKVETAASGKINDTAGTGVIVGIALESKADETVADVFLTIVPPPGS